MDPLNPRALVKAAAARTKNPSTRDWLECDERGTWERTAAEILADPRKQELAKKHNLTDQQISDEIAAYLSYLALSATLANLKRERTSRENERVRRKAQKQSDKEPRVKLARRERSRKP